MVRSTTPGNTAKKMFEKMDAELGFLSVEENSKIRQNGLINDSDDAEACLECLSNF